MAASTATIRKVRLQKVGNSLRATIPKEMADLLSLKDGDIVNIMTSDSDDDRAKIVIEKVDDKVPTMAKFYGLLKVKKGTRKWPSPEEIKSIWE